MADQITETVDHSQHIIAPLSAKIGQSLIRGWQVGGEALALLIFGALLIIMAFIFLLNGNAYLAYASFGTGFLIISIIAYILIVKTLIPLRKASKSIEENAELLDAVQQSTLFLTGIIRQFSDYALMNSRELVRTVEISKNYLRGIPTAERIFSLPAFQRTEDLGYRIHEIAERSSSVVSEVADSISRSDASRIKDHLTDLRNFRSYFENEWLKPKVSVTEGVSAPPRLESEQLGRQAMLDQKRLIVLEAISLRLIEVIGHIAASVDLETRESVEKIEKLKERFPIVQSAIKVLSINSTQEFAKRLQASIAATSQQLQDVSKSIKSDQPDDLTKVIAAIDKIIALVEGVRSKQKPE